MIAKTKQMEHIKKYVVIVKDFMGVILKQKKCKNCLKYFIPEREIQPVCSFECAIEWSKKPKAKKAYKMEKKKELIEKYPDIVTVYTIGDVSKELCGGPHVNNTKELGKFKIKKEESSSSGVRRIKAVLIKE